MVGIRRLRFVLSLAALFLVVSCQSVQTHDDGKSWGEAERLSDPGEALRPDVGLDSTGHAVAVWDEAHPPEVREDLWSSHSPNPGAGWSGAELVERVDTGPALFPRIAMADEGNAVVVWQQEGTDGSARIWSNRYSAEAGWDVEEIIAEVRGNARRPEVAMDRNGTAVAVWYQADGGPHSIYSNRYTPGGGWGGAELIEEAEGDARRPQVAVSSGGGAVAVWAQFSSRRSVVWSNRATPDGVWRTSRPIDDDNEAGDATRPHVAVDSSGNAVAVWQQFDGARENIWSNRYTIAMNDWGTAELIETDNGGDASAPQVAMGPGGSTLAVWSQFDGTNDDIWSNRFTRGAGWGMAERIGGSSIGEALNPKVAMDGNGAAVAVWTQPGDAYTGIWSNRYAPSSGWGTAERLNPDIVGDATSPEVAMEASGNAVAVWTAIVRGLQATWSSRLGTRGSE